MVFRAAKWSAKMSVQSNQWTAISALCSENGWWPTVIMHTESNLNLQHIYLSTDPLNASVLQLTSLVLVDCLRNHWPFWSVLHPYQLWVLASKRRVYARSSETWARRHDQSCTVLQLCIPHHLGILLNPENKVDINSQYGLIHTWSKQLTLLDIEERPNNRRLVSTILPVSCGQYKSASTHCYWLVLSINELWSNCWWQFYWFSSLNNYRLAILICWISWVFLD